jgi:hypothetical protein
MPFIDLESPLNRASGTSALDASNELGRITCADGAHGYRDGYERALHNLLSSLVPLAEQHLAGRNNHAASARRELYAFIEYLEQHIEQAAADVGYVFDGLGI